MDSYSQYIANVTGGNIQHVQLNPDVYESLTHEGREALDLTSQFVAPITDNYHRMREYALQQTSTLVNPFDIYPILNMDVLQYANIAMGRWINSHPQVRKQYLETNEPILGYEPNVADRSVGINNYDYRRSHDGVVVKENDQYLRRNFYEHIHNDIDNLSLEQRISIHRTFKFVDESIEAGIWIDPEDDIIYY